VVLGVATLASVGVLFASDTFPRLFSAKAHESLTAIPLAMIALAYLVYQAVHRPHRLEVVKALLLAIAFLLWAAIQRWPDMSQAALLNDGAIALFVLDVFLVIVGWPSRSPDKSPTEVYAELPEQPPSRSLFYSPARWRDPISHRMGAVDPVCGCFPPPRTLVFGEFAQRFLRTPAVKRQLPPAQRRGCRPF
jgi:hypothetical protein